MKTTGISQRSTGKRLAVWAGIVAALLMIPVLANFPWTTGDFVFAGVVLFGLATTYELVTRNMSNKLHRIAVGFAVVMVLIFIWGWAVS